MGSGAGQREASTQNPSYRYSATRGRGLMRDMREYGHHPRVLHWLRMGQASAAHTMFQLGWEATQNSRPLSTVWCR